METILGDNLAKIKLVGMKTLLLCRWQKAVDMFHSKYIVLSWMVCLMWYKYVYLIYREAEAAFVLERDESTPGHEWEKICRLCEFNPKHSRNTKDVSRMRSILLQLKQTPLVRWSKIPRKMSNSINWCICGDNLICYFSVCKHRINSLHTN